MPADDVRLHPDHFDPNAAQPSTFRSPLSVPREFRLAPVNRAQHAASLKQKLEQAEEASDEAVEAQKARGIDGGHGIAVEFVGAANFEMKFDSLDVTRSGIELLNVRPRPDGSVYQPSTDGKLYAVNSQGEVVVIATGDDFKVLGRSPLGEASHATPAIAGGAMYLRTERHLISVGGKKEAALSGG